MKKQGNREVFQGDLKEEKLILIVDNIWKDEGNNNNFAWICDCLHNSTIENHISNRSSYKERKGNALASGAEEGRDKLR